MKSNIRNGFTLVELLAVLVILAVILVIAIPKVMDIIKDVRISTLESTAKLVALSAEKKKIENEIIGNNEILTCENVVKINDIDYESCYIEFIDNKAVVTIIGKGTFKGMNACEATKTTANIKERCLNKKVEVTLELNGGIATDITRIYKEGTIIDLEEPIKENSTFTSYKIVSGNSVIKDNKLTVGSTNTIVHAVYKSWPSLEIDLDGGNDNTNYNEKYKSGSIIELEVPTKTGYTFTGWSILGNGAVLSNNNLTIGTSDVELTANWEANTYIVTFDPNGGNALGESMTYTSSGQHTYKVTSSEEYQLEVWGAQGGGNGGYGGYSSGIINLEENQSLFITVGGQGGRNDGGYNGGGNGQLLAGTVSPAGYGGGGATHIASTSGLLKDIPINNVYIIAGGGGGGSENNTIGGHAGGYIGNDGTGTCYSAKGGTQTSGGKAGDTDAKSGGYGYGGNAPQGKDVLKTYGAGGGGSGFYGGGGSSFTSGTDCAGGGAGGSGYIGNTLLRNKVMYCYECKTSENANTLTFSTKKVDTTPIYNYSKKGNGAARITKLLLKKNIIYNSIYTYLPTPTRDGYTFIGWNTKNDGRGVYITNNTIMTISENHTLYAIWE